MNFIDLQLVTESKDIPSEMLFQRWMDIVLTDSGVDSEVLIRIVDEDEMIQLNQQYRNKQGTTNILSFPFDVAEDVDNILLGDLVVCAPVVEQESQEQGKLLEHHWAHMIIHGLLHLLGYDHINDDEADEMESLEIKFLTAINISNPYEEERKK